MHCIFINFIYFYYVQMITDWPEKIIITASLNLQHETQHRPARFKSAQPEKDSTQLLFEQTHLICINQKMYSTDVPLVDSRGADPARA